MMRRLQKVRPMTTPNASAVSETPAIRSNVILHHPNLVDTAHHNNGPYENLAHLSPLIAFTANLAIYVLVLLFLVFSRRRVYR